MKKISKFNEHSNLDKIKSEWKDFEDQQPIEFDAFWNRVKSYSDHVSDYQNSYQFLHRNSDIVFEIKLESWSNTTETKDPDWRKRNGEISVITETGGYSGGSCWNDDPAERYDTSNRVYIDDLIGYLDHILSYIFGKDNSDVREMLEYLRANPYGFVVEDSYTNYEYYGNSQDYESFSITLWNLYKLVSKFYLL